MDQDQLDKIVKKKMTMIWDYINAEARVGGYHKIAGMPCQPSHASDPRERPVVQAPHGLHPKRGRQTFSRR